MSTDADLREAATAWYRADIYTADSFTICSRLRDRLRGTSSHRAYGWASLTYGRIAHAKGQLSESEIALAEAIGRLCYVDDHYGQVLAEAHLALPALGRRNISRALELALRPWSSNIRFRDPDLDLLHVLTSASYYESGDPHSALLHLTKAYQTAKRSQDKSRQEKIAANLGAVLWDLGECEIALPILQQSWHFHEKQISLEKPTYLVPLINLVGCEIELTGVESARSNGDLLFGYLSSSNNFLHMFGLHNLCELYFLLKEFEKGDWCLDKMRMLIEANPSTQFGTMLLTSRGLALESRQNFREAYELTRPLLVLPETDITPSITRTVARLLSRLSVALGKSSDSVRFGKIAVSFGRDKLVGSVLAKQISLSFAAGQPHSLTEQEMACLSLSARGQTSADIAQKLGIKPRTVNFHFTNVRRKLNAMNRQEAIAKAISTKILEL